MIDLGFASLVLLSDMVICEGAIWWPWYLINRSGYCDVYAALMLAKASM
jgi:hypothetical protein